MDNIIEGRIIQKLDIESGQSARGPWQKQNFIVETQEQYPRKVCIGLWTNQIQILQSYQIGDMIRAYVNIESREFNGRWYTDVRAWKLENPANAPMPQQGMPYAPQGMPMQQPMQQPYQQPMQQPYQQPMQQPYQQPQQPTFEAPGANLPDDGSGLPF